MFPLPFLTNFVLAITEHVSSYKFIMLIKKEYQSHHIRAFASDF